MSIRSFRQILVVALGVSFSSVAFARTPPSLAKLQQASESAVRASGGYRDINWRFGSVPARSPQVMRSAGGYRDVYHRFPGAVPSTPRSASNPVTSRWR
jgi:hypothetical protein